MEQVHYLQLVQAIEYLRTVVEELMDRHSAEFNIEHDDKVRILRLLRGVSFEAS